MIARSVLAPGAVLLACAAWPAFAQGATPFAPPPAAAPAAPEDGVIVITARRRSENLQEVPMAVSVVGAERLAATGSNNVARLTQIQPSLQFFSTNPRNSAANIRGLGAPFGLTNDGIEQGVGVYIDQIYMSRIAAATFDFLDVERIEVLRGPQGTLYGKNTTAGAVNVVTRSPSFAPEGSAQLSIGNLDYLSGALSLSGPILDDVLAFRLAAGRSRRRGTVLNVVTGQRVNGQDNLGLRAQLQLRAALGLNLTLAGDYNRQDPSCCAQLYVRTGATQRPLPRQFAGLAAAFGYAPPSTNPFDRLTDVDAPLRATQALGGVALRAEWTLGPGMLTSVSAWRFWDWDPSNDRDFTGLPITTVSANPSRQDQYSQELRLAGTSGPLDYVLGAFAYHQRQRTTGAQEQGAAASRWLLNPGNVALGAAGCLPPAANACNPAVLDGLRSDNDISFSSTSLAVFAQLGWRVTDRLRLQPGLRVNYDRKRGSYLAVITTGAGSTFLSADQRGVLAPQAYRPQFFDWNLSYDFTLSYDLADHVLGYATYARAFKSGGINLSGLPLDAASNPILAAATVAAERVNHFELGLRSQFLDRRLTLNLAAFWTIIDDYQATVTNGQLGVLRGYLANADRVRVRGLELELFARPSDRLDLYVSGALTDGRYVRFIDAPCPPELSGGSIAAAGQATERAGDARRAQPRRLRHLRPAPSRYLALGGLLWRGIPDPAASVRRRGRHSPRRRRQRPLAFLV